MTQLTTRRYVIPAINISTNVHTYVTQIEQFAIKMKKKHTYSFSCTFVDVIRFYWFRIYSLNILYRVIHDLRTLLQEMTSWVFVIRKVHTNTCPISDGYGDMAAWNLRRNIEMNGTKQ